MSYLAERRARVIRGNLISWENSAVEVKAELVPRYLYTTASIDVYVDGSCILRTGGVWRFWGTQGADFMHGGKSHLAELSWGSAKSLWYALKIDGQCILKGDLIPRNFPAIMIPAALAMAFIWLFAHLSR
jgi:hypothetical protein